MMVIEQRLLTAPELPAADLLALRPEVRGAIVRAMSPDERRELAIASGKLQRCSPLVAFSALLQEMQRVPRRYGVPEVVCATDEEACQVALLLAGTNSVCVAANDVVADAVAGQMPLVRPGINRVLLMLGNSNYVIHGVTTFQRVGQILISIKLSVPRTA